MMGDRHRTSSGRSPFHGQLSGTEHIRPQRDHGGLAGALIVLLGLAVGTLMVALVVVARSADQARDDAAAATSQTRPPHPFTTTPPMRPARRACR